MSKVISLVSILLLAPLSGTARAEAPPTTTWVRSWNAPANHEDIGRFVAVDTPDKIYVAGTTYEPGVGGASHDYLLLQYDSEGNLRWYRRYGGPNWESPSDLVVPVSGEVLVTGLSAGESGLEVATVKYDDLGNILWERRHGAAGAFSDFGPKLACDADGNVIVSSGDGGDYLVLKYAPTGSLLWSRTYDGPAGGDDLSTDVAVDALGNIYVTGTANSLQAFATVKYSPTGDFLWEQIEPGDFGSVFAPSQVEVGPDDNPVVAGSPESTCGVFQFKIWKCAAASGGVLWSHHEPSLPCHSFTFQDLALDGTGAALAVCSGSATSGDIHMQILRFAPDGAREWIREFDGPGTAEDIAAAIAVDAAGAAYAVGYTTNPPQNRDYAAVKYSAGGLQEWSFTWASASGTNDLGHNICTDPSGDVILTGNSYDPVQNENAVSIKLHQASAAGTGGDLPQAAARSPLLRVVPNPTAGRATVFYEIPRAGRYQLDLVSADGRAVRRLAEGDSPSGLHELSWTGVQTDGSRLPAGIYFVRLAAAGRIASARVGVLP